MFRKYSRLSITQQILGFGVVCGVLLCAIAASTALDVKRDHARTLSKGILDAVARLGDHTHNNARGKAVPLRDFAPATDELIAKPLYRFSAENALNKDNEASSLDKEALAYLHANPQALVFEKVTFLIPNSFVEAAPGQKGERRLLSVYPVLPDQSCLGCHTTWKNTGIVGAVSVSVPYDYGFLDFLSSWSQATWLLAFLFVAFLVMVGVYLQLYVIQAVRHIRNYVKGTMDNEKPARVLLDDDERSSDNEIHQLSYMTYSLAKAVGFLRTSFNGESRDSHLRSVK